MKNDNRIGGAQCPVDIGSARSGVERRWTHGADRRHEIIMIVQEV